jgi:DNA-binding FadR family transcriptional regulator
VREALRLLASQHLIVTTRGVTGGSFVAHPDAEQLADGLAAGFTLLTNSADVDLADMLELRRALEVPAAGLAAVRRSPQHLSEIRGTIFEPGVDDFDRRLAAHVEFHLAVAKATGNPLFELVVRPLYCASYGEDLTEALPPGYWERMDADHRQLLDRLTAQDADGASVAAARHLDYIVAVTS